MRAILIIMVLLLVIGGAAGAYFGLGINPFGGDEEAEQAQVEPDDPRFLTMRPFIVPLFEGQRIAWHVDVELSLEAVSEEDFEYLTLHANVLRDTFTLELASYLNLQWAEFRELDVLLIKRRLRLVAGQVVGRGHVREVTIINLHRRPPGVTR